MTGPSLAGEFWPLVDNGDEARSLGPWEFAAECVSRARDVLEAEGYAELNPRDRGDYEALLKSVEPGSRADVALSLFAEAMTCRASLGRAVKGSGDNQARIEVTAGLYANLGMLWAVLHSMGPAGLTALAGTGRRVMAGGPQGGAARREQLKAEVLSKYGARALEIAAEARTRAPSVSRAEIARRIRRAGDQGDARLPHLPADDKAITTFLKENGF